MANLIALFSSVNFMPHGNCYLWTPTLVWSFVVSDALIALAYYSIPFSLLYFIHRKKHFEYKLLGILFSLFILACGTTHLISIITIWMPLFWLDAGVKIITAGISVMAAILLWPILPKVLALPTAKQLLEANQALEREVNERKQTEQALKESEERLKEAQHIARIGHWRYDSTYQMLTCSDELYHLYGWNAEHFQPVFDDLLRTAVENDYNVAEHLKNIPPKQRRTFDFTILRPDEKIRWLQMVVVKEVDEDESVSYRGTVQDITERKKSELIQAKQSRVKEFIAHAAPLQNVFNQLLETCNVISQNMKGVILLLDKDNETLHPAASIGLPEFYYQALEGLKIGDLGGAGGVAAARRERVVIDNIQTHPCCAKLKALAKQANVESCWSEPIIAASGEVLGAITLYYRTTTLPDREELDFIENAARLAAIAIERKQQEEAMREAKELAEQANRAKNVFLSRMSHELYTPMNAILGFTQLLEMDESISQDQLDTVKEIHEAGDSLMELINDILDLSRIESGSIDITLEPVNPVEVCEACLGIIAPLIEAHGLTLTRTIDSQQVVKGNATRLKQVVLNLLHNAIKYNYSGGSISVVLDDRDGQVCISISNTGDGLTRKEVTELFTPFKRFSADEKAIGGIGVGLALSKQLVDLMGGVIEVESAPGLNTFFRVLLPVYQ